MDTANGQIEQNEQPAVSQAVAEREASMQGGPVVTSWWKRNVRLVVLLGVLAAAVAVYILVLVWKPGNSGTVINDVESMEKAVSTPTLAPTLIPTAIPIKQEKVGFVKLGELAPEGMVWYQDLENGFAFAYPEKWELKGAGQYLSLKTDTGEYLSVNLFDRLKSLTGEFENGIVEKVANSCAADGPTGSEYCPEEKITIDSMVSTGGVDGYNLTRVRVIERYLLENSKEEFTEKVIAYELPDNSEYFSIIFMPVNSAMDEEVELAGNTFRWLEKVGN